MESAARKISEFSGVKVKKAWGREFEVFNNGVVSCWYLRIERDQETSLHMHKHKQTAMIILAGSALLQEGLMSSRPISALDKTRFSARFFHRHAAINGPCELLEIEHPIDKADLYRFKDSYGRAGAPYESRENYEALTDDDPQFVGGRMVVGDTVLRTFEFATGQAFVTWARKLPYWSIVILTRGSLRSSHGEEIVAPGDANWSQNLRDLLCDTWPDENVAAILVRRDDDRRI